MPEKRLSLPEKYPTTYVVLVTLFWAFIAMSFFRSCIAEPTILVSANSTNQYRITIKDASSLDINYRISLEEIEMGKSKNLSFKTEDQGDIWKNLMAIWNNRETAVILVGRGMPYRHPTYKSYTIYLLYDFSTHSLYREPHSILQQLKAHHWETPEIDGFKILLHK